HRAVRVPVFDIQQRVPYAVSVSLPTAKLQQIGVKALIKPVLATAQRISQELGFVIPA
ncbi:MAG: IclR family transcriptional regulator, partial [Serratia liquefaciens]|nr:IclR family transcriptional regulator [Serratia liquefaciens]